MSNLPPEELTEIEEVVTPNYVGLPKSLQSLNEKQLQEHLAQQLREWRKQPAKEQSDEPQP